MAGYHMLVADLLSRRWFVVANVANPTRTAGQEWTTFGRVHYARQNTLKNNVPLLDLRIGDGYRRQQCFHIRVVRRRKYLFGSGHAP